MSIVPEDDKEITMFVSSLFVVMFSFFFFLLDVTVGNLMGHFWLHSLLGFFVLTLFARKLSWLHIIPLLLLALESLIFFNRFGLTLVYVIPSIFLLQWVKKRSASKLFGTLMSYAFLLILHYLLFSVFVLKHHPFELCTFLQMGVNLILVYFSLKWLPTVKRGNRF